MSNSILIAGNSSTGKSTSIRSLPTNETIIFQVIAKALPFRGGQKYTKTKKNLFVSDDVNTIVNGLIWAKTQPNVKYIIIDDSQYIMANEFFRRAHENGFQKFTQIAQNFHKVVVESQKLRDDQFVFFMHHTELDTNGSIKVKTIGKMIDDQMCVEGFFSIVLHSVRKDNSYSFITNGYGVAKSPFDMLPIQMENNLADVVSMINDYYTEEVEPVETPEEKEGGE